MAWFGHTNDKLISQTKIQKYKIFEKFKGSTVVGGERNILSIDFGSHFVQKYYFIFVVLSSKLVGHK